MTTTGCVVTSGHRAPGGSRKRITGNVRELEARLSQCPRFVKAGGAVEFTERGVPIGRIVPIAAPIEDRLDAMARRGSLQWEARRLPRTAPVARARGARSVADPLIEDRTGSSTAKPTRSSSATCLRQVPTRSGRSWPPHRRWARRSSAARGGRRARRGQPDGGRAASRGRGGAEGLRRRVNGARTSADERDARRVARRARVASARCAADPPCASPCGCRAARASPT